MNVDFIKWMVKYADGFEIIESAHDSWDINTPVNETFYTDELNDEVWQKILYPLLLQRSIEGINKSGSSWTIWVNEYYKKIYANWKDGNNNKSKNYPISENIDEAKEEPLKYIYEQEKNND